MAFGYTDMDNSAAWFNAELENPPEDDDTPDEEIDDEVEDDDLDDEIEEDEPKDEIDILAEKEEELEIDEE